MPKRFRMIGSIDPTVQPAMMMKSTVMPTVSAKRNVWSGYIITRPIAMPAIMMPSTMPHAELAEQDAPPVARLDLAEREAADDQRRRLRARVAARRDEERHVEQRALHGLHDGVVVAKRGLREELLDEEDDEPAGALLDEREEARLEVGHVERLDGADLLDVLGLLLDEDVDDVVDRDDAEQLAVVGDDRA